MGNSKIVYSYHPETSEYLGEIMARRDPLEIAERYLIPACATEIMPDLQEGKISKWDGANWVNMDISLLSKSELTVLESELISLEEVKRAKLDKLLMERMVFQYSNIQIGINIFVNTDKAQNKFFNKIKRKNAADFPIDWRLYDYSWIRLSYDDALALEAAIGNREYSAYKQETDYVNQINACITIEEINAITFEFVSLV
jgi:hypothetical protein